jgi:hypothetical protein
MIMGVGWGEDKERCVLLSWAVTWVRTMKVEPLTARVRRHNHSVIFALNTAK